VIKRAWMQCKSSAALMLYASNDRLGRLAARQLSYEQPVGYWAVSRRSALAVQTELPDNPLSYPRGKKMQEAQVPLRWPRLTRLLLP
jgi:hypothetical protein